MPGVTSMRNPVQRENRDNIVLENVYKEDIRA